MRLNHPDLVFLHMSSGWFDCTEPSLTSFQGKQVCRVLMHSFGVVQAYRTASNLLEPQHRSSQQKQGVQGARTQGRGGSSVSNLLEPSRTTS